MGKIGLPACSKDYTSAPTSDERFYLHSPAALLAGQKEQRRMGGCSLVERVRHANARLDADVAQRPSALAAPTAIVQPQPQAQADARIAARPGDAQLLAVRSR